MIINRLKMIMAERNYSIQDIKDNTKLSRTTISNLVNDYSAGIQFDTLDELCTFLKVNTNELFDFIDYKIDIKSSSLNNITINDNIVTFNMNLDVTISVDHEIYYFNTDYLNIEFEISPLKELERVSISNYLEIEKNVESIKEEYKIKDRITGDIDTFIIDQFIEFPEVIENIGHIVVYHK